LVSKSKVIIFLNIFKISICDLEAMCFFVKCKKENVNII